MKLENLKLSTPNLWLLYHIPYYSTIYTYKDFMQSNTLNHLLNCFDPISQSPDVHLVDSSCRFASCFGTGIAPYHSSKPPTGEKRNCRCEKNNQDLLRSLSLSCFLSPPKKIKARLYDVPSFLPFKTTKRQPFEEKKTKKKTPNPYKLEWNHSTALEVHISNHLVVVDARGYRVAHRQRVAPRNIAQHLKHIPARVGPSTKPKRGMNIHGIWKIHVEHEEEVFQHWPWFSLIY